VTVELRLAAEQLGTAGAAAVHARGLGVDVLAGPRALGARLAEHVVLLGGELPAPLLLALPYGSDHTSSLRTRSATPRGGNDHGPVVISVFPGESAWSRRNDHASVVISRPRTGREA